VSAIDDLTSELARLPGIGRKTALRLTYHLLKQPPEQSRRLAEALQTLSEKVRPCSRCFNLTEEELCAICRDPRRDPGLICVVEQPRDLLAMERAGTYSGVYHVLLGRLAPLQGMGPEGLTLDALVERVRSGTVRELIMATNPNLEGDGTALLVANRLAELDVPITRLARGLASGSVLEFANKEMLADAFLGRQRF
jgi:recombination protein RecR